MPVFTKKIQVQTIGTMEFHFNRIYTVDGVRYFISLVDKNHETHHFKMEERNGNWVISDNPSLPLWIYSVQDELDVIIRNHVGI